MSVNLSKKQPRTSVLCCTIHEHFPCAFIVFIENAANRAQFEVQLRSDLFDSENHALQLSTSELLFAAGQQITIKRQKLHDSPNVKDNK